MPADTREIHCARRRLSRLRFALPIALALLTLAAVADSAPARANRSPAIGIAENNSAIFTDPLFTKLKITRTRVVAPYDVMSRGHFARDRLRTYLELAHARHIVPLVTFEHSAGGAAKCKHRKYRKRRPCRLPSTRSYQRNFRKFMKAFPWVREVAPWNEANHPTQPTNRHPVRAAQYANIVHKVCRRCTVALYDVLDQADQGTNLRKFPRYAKTLKWIRRYRRALKVKRTVCGLHNYSDINRFRRTGTAATVRAMRCRRVWLTEAGPIYRYGGFKRSSKRQRRALKWTFKLAAKWGSITRVYVYSWYGVPTSGWDSGLTARGRPRPVYKDFRKRVLRAHRARAERHHH